MTEKAGGTAAAVLALAMARHNSEYSEIFRSLFDHSGMSMASLDSELFLREANMDFLAHFDRKPQDSYGRPFLSMLHPTVRRRIGHDLTSLSTGDRDRVSGKIIAVRRDGSLLFGDMTAVSAHKPDGDLDTILVLVSRASRIGRAQAIVQRGMQLTPMDARILEGVAAGVSTAKLATALHMSRGGVEYRITTLLRMLKAINRTELVSKAYSMGLFNTESWPPSVLPEYIQA